VLLLAGESGHHLPTTVFNIVLHYSLYISKYNAHGITATQSFTTLFLSDLPAVDLFFEALNFAFIPRFQFSAIFPSISDVVVFLAITRCALNFTAVNLRRIE
jgi:hypothetical protein